MSDVELLAVSLCPFYLLREFPKIFMRVVYIHPKADAVSAANTIFEVLVFEMEQKLQSIAPEAPSFILGDFNHVPLRKVLSHYHQYVTCLTRRSKTLDLCYGSVKVCPKMLNDLRPVALTSVVIILEIFVKYEILRSNEFVTVDPMQFAYKSKRCRRCHRYFVAFTYEAFGGEGVSRKSFIC